MCKVFSPNEINVHTYLCQKIRQCFQKIKWELEMNWTQESENVNYIICIHKKSLLNSNWYSVAKNLLRFCQVFYIQCVIIINRNWDMWSIESQFIVEFSIFLVRWPFISWYLEFLLYQVQYNWGCNIFISFLCIEHHYSFSMQGNCRLDLHQNTKINWRNALLLFIKEKYLALDCSKARIDA